VDAVEAISKVNLNHVDWAMAGVAVDDGMDEVQLCLAKL